MFSFHIKSSLKKNINYFFFSFSLTNFTSSSFDCPVFLAGPLLTLALFGFAANFLTPTLFILFIFNIKFTKKEYSWVFGNKL